MILEKELYNSITETRSFFKSVYTFVISCSGNIFAKSKQLTEVQHRGLPKLRAAADCTLCNDCVAICPTSCLSIEQKNEQLVKMNLNVLACTFCGLCAEVCEKDLLTLTETRALASHYESRWIIDLVSDNGN